MAKGKSNELSERANASFCFRVTALIAEMVVRHTRLALGKYVDDMRGDDGHPGVQTMVAVTIVVLMLWLIGDSKIMLIILLPIVAFFAVWFPTGRFELPLKQAGFSVWFIMLVSLANGGLSIRIDDTRIVDVGIGLLTSFVVTAIMWPNGVAAHVRAVLKGSVSATAAYFAAAIVRSLPDYGLAPIPVARGLACTVRALHRHNRRRVRAERGRR